MGGRGGTEFKTKSPILKLKARNEEQKDGFKNKCPFQIVRSHGLSVDVSVLRNCAVQNTRPRESLGTILARMACAHRPSSRKLR